MPARHYRVEYTEDEANYTLLSADEAPGPGKTAQLTGLASGTHTGKLRLTPLTGDATPVLSLPFTFQVGTLGIAEPVQAAATTSATVADVMTLRDNLLAAIGVQVTSASTFSGGDQLAVSATVTASAADLRVMSEQLVAAISAQASATDLQAMAESLVVAIAGDASVLDVQPGLVVDNLLTSITAQATAADVQTIAEQLVAAATAQATQADGLIMRENVSAAATATATIADVKAMLESVLAAATAQATVSDSVSAGATTISENFPTQAPLTRAATSPWSTASATWNGWTVNNLGIAVSDYGATIAGSTAYSDAPYSLMVVPSHNVDPDTLDTADVSGFKVVKKWDGPFAAGTFTIKYRVDNNSSGMTGATMDVNGSAVTLTKDGSWHTATVSLGAAASITLTIQNNPASYLPAADSYFFIDQISFA